MPKDDRLIVGAETCDDAGVYRLNDDTAIIQTLDFFTPIVDDPYNFGQITAANALSDVYAMGGTPLLAMNILACPIATMEAAVIRKVIQGGLSKVEEAGALLVGGHSIEDNELKYGLSVTGLVHPEQVLLNSGAKPGDRSSVHVLLIEFFVFSHSFKDQVAEFTNSTMSAGLFGGVMYHFLYFQNCVSRCRRKSHTF